MKGKVICKGSHRSTNLKGHTHPRSVVKIQTIARRKYLPKELIFLSDISMVKHSLAVICSLARNKALMSLNLSLTAVFIKSEPQKLLNNLQPRMLMGMMIKTDNDDMRRSLGAFDE